MSHDPFSPSASAQPATVEAQAQLDKAYGEFPETRYRDAGATDEQVTVLRAQWSALDDAARGAEGQRIAGLSADAVAEMVAAADPSADNPFGKNVDDVIAAVGADPEKARAALDAENARTKPRSTLVEHLTAVIDEAAAPTLPTTAGEPGGGDASAT